MKALVVTLLAMNAIAVHGLRKAYGEPIVLDGIDLDVAEGIEGTGQFSAVDNLLTGAENLIMMGDLYRVSDSRRRAAELLEQFGLAQAADKFVMTYSGGMRRIDVCNADSSADGSAPSSLAIV